MEAKSMEAHEEVERDKRGRVVQVHYLPTPKQIAEECQRIQQTWSPRDRRNRHYMARYRVEVQVVSHDLQHLTE
jgi:hypothetical protein